MKTLKDVDLIGKKVLVRVDFNVPLKDGQILDDERIRATLPTINYLLDRNCSIELISHLGRPKGKVVSELSLEPVAERLAQLLNRTLRVEKVKKVEKKFFIDPPQSRSEAPMSMLENIRFWPEEEAGDKEFAKMIASLGEVFVQEAFACCHRPHASIIIPEVKKDMPACAGFLVEKEIKFLSMLLEKPERPFVAILGGAKVSDKIGIIENLLDKVDALLIGGAMAYTFLKAIGCTVGNSRIEKDQVAFARKILKKGGIILPADHIVATKIDPPTNVFNTFESRLLTSQDIPSGFFGADIGYKTINLFTQRVRRAKTVFWNGPLGIFEIEKFSEGTKSIAQVLADVDATTVVGGGETLAAIKKAGVADKISHVSTGGGATLEFLEGKTLPGIAALE